MIARRRARTLALTLVLAVLVPDPALARVRSMTLEEFAWDADFIGVVRVDRIGARIPFLKRPHATATIIESWKGKTTGTVTFGASPTWICDISTARKGEEAVVFIVHGELQLGGRGRMPIFVRDARRLAAIWPEVILARALPTEPGPEPEYEFIRGVAVLDLRAAVERLVSGNAKELDVHGQQHE